MAKGMEGKAAAPKELMDKLNEAIANELQVSVQYMWHHVMVKGVTSETVGDALKKVAITEMKHAEDLAERLNYLGGVPTIKPSPIELAKGTEEILTLDRKAEERAISLYREIIRLADKEGDFSTGQLMRKILAQEEEHHDLFTRLLGE